MNRPSPGAGRGHRSAAARDAEGRRLFVTGKKWPTRFEIETVAPAP